MKRLFLSIITLLCILSGCCPKLYPQIEKEEYNRDTIVKERLIRDTLFFEIPAEKEDVITKDSVSFLENKFAESRAEIKNGLLHHTLSTKHQNIEIPHVTPITETIISTNVLRVVVREVERNLTVWESFQIVMGRLFLIVLFLSIIIYSVKKFRR